MNGIYNFYITKFINNPDYDLNIMKQGQTLGEITTRALVGLEEVIKECKPNIVLIHVIALKIFRIGEPKFSLL